MRNKPLCMAALAALCLLSACGKSENNTNPGGSNVTLTTEQRTKVDIDRLAGMVRDARPFAALLTMRMFVSPHPEEAAPFN